MFKYLKYRKIKENGYISISDRFSTTMNIGYDGKINSKMLRNLPSEIKYIIDECKIDPNIDKVRIISHLLIDRNLIKKNTFIKNKSNFINKNYLNLLKNEILLKEKTYKSNITKYRYFILHTLGLLLNFKKPFKVQKCKYIGELIIDTSNSKI